MLIRFVLLAASLMMALSLPSVAAAQSAPGGNTDYNGDGKADFAVYRPSEARWYIFYGPGYTTASFVAFTSFATDTILPAGDYDGDGRIDIAFYRGGPNTLFSAEQLNRYYVLTGASNFTVAFSIAWGENGDAPVPADYSGDGRLDVANFRPSENRFYILQGLGGTSYGSAFTVAWGIAGDTLVPADYDGDGRTDIGVWRPSEKRFYIIQQRTTGTSNLFTTAFSVLWGEIGDILVPGDYSNDGRGDIAVYRPGPNTLFAGEQINRWYVLQRLADGTFGAGYVIVWGADGDIALPGDWNGDGALDAGVYRPSEKRLYVLLGPSYSSAFSITWGATGDQLIGRLNPLGQIPLVP